MTIYMYFNLLYLTDKAFQERLHQLNDQYGTSPLEIGIECNQFNFVRMNIASTADISKLILPEFWKVTIFQ